MVTVIRPLLPSVQAELYHIVCVKCGLEPANRQSNNDAVSELVALASMRRHDIADCQHNGPVFSLYNARMMS